MIPSEKQQESGRFKLVNGEWHKLCTGPAHDEPTWLPATEKYFYVHKSGKREGMLLSRCRLCANWHKLKTPPQKGLQGLVPASAARRYYMEASNRVGVMELAKRTGLTYGNITDVIQGRIKNVQRRTFRRVMIELVSIRRHNENSINEYARWRVTRRATGGEVCDGCGGSLEGTTEGCRTCLYRHDGRKRRAK